MLKVKVIKTLPHLVPVHVVQERPLVYATAFSPQIVKYLAGVQILAPREISHSGLVKKLSEKYEKYSEVSSQGQYAVKGDVVQVWITGYEQPVRVEFFGERAEVIEAYDIITGRGLLHLDHIAINFGAQLDATDSKEVHVVTDMNEDSRSPALVFSRFSPEIVPEGVETESYDYTYPNLFWNRLDIFAKELSRLKNQGYRVFVQSHHYNRLPNKVVDLVDEPDYQVSNLPAGFVSASQKVALFTDREIFGTIYLSSPVDDSNTSKLLRKFEGEISVNDFVVHEQHGIGIYSGLTQEIVDNEMREYLRIRYTGEDEVLVPINQIERLTKYIGDGTPPKLSSLSRKTWESEKTKVKKSVSILAKELIEHYARREMSHAQTVAKDDSGAYKKFVGAFAYVETTDQLQCTNEIITDLESTTPMNRLLIGDVGFGKTEVMMRAAFKMVEAGRQVAVLCPTTVLAAQHYAVFSERFSATHYKIESLSRFNTAKENKDLVDKLNSGNVDIAIGTHRLLSKDVKFKNLGLLVVDEEQRFGVRQKERIKQLNYGVHHLAVSATPIPRTMSMALATIQDISIISTPPGGRKPIKTELIRSDWNRVVKAIHTELEREGQVYFVHNEVQSIPSVQARLQELMPGLNIKVAHGQMSPASLDQAMADFYQHKADILLCTTIIENGLDLPNVNTIIINNANHFGLSQLHQLRGRIGRATKQGYCYLFYEGKKTFARPDESSPDSSQPPRAYLERLQSIVDATDLGAGFHVATRDLEIRGAGNLLGEKQHGHIAQVGYALYMKLLANEVEKLKKIKEGIKPEYVTL